MAEQIPETWIGQEVTVYFGSEGYSKEGTLEFVSERGVVVRSVQGVEGEHIFWHPLTCVIRIRQGRPQGADVRSY